MDNILLVVVGLIITVDLILILKLTGKRHGDPKVGGEIENPYLPKTKDRGETDSNRKKLE